MDWKDSPQLNDRQKELMQAVIDGIDDSAAQSGFELLLNNLAKGPFQYLVYYEGNIVGHTNDEALATHVEENTDMRAFDLTSKECQKEVTGEDVGLDEGYDEEEDDDEEED